MQRRLLGDHDLEVSRTLNSLALVLLRECRFTDAEPLARECLAIREKKLPDDWGTFYTQVMLGAALLKQEKHADAEPLLLSGYAGMAQRETAIRNKDRHLLRKALQNLLDLYQASRRPDRAAEWKQKLDDFERAETNRVAPGPSHKPPP